MKGIETKWRLAAIRSRSIHPFGSATLDQNSPHYADQPSLLSIAN